MAHVKLVEHFDAPIEQVFDLLVDEKRWPEWMASDIEIKEVTGPLDRAGTRMLSVTKMFGRAIESWDEVSVAERPRVWGWKGDSGGFKYASTFHLTPAGGGTDIDGEGDFEISVGFLGHIADRLFLERAVERQMRHSLENFKALVEARVAVPA